MDAAELRQSLRNGIVSVTFTKKDGSSRTLNATLNEALLPPKKPDNGKPKRQYPEDYFNVWSVDDRDWRSFSFDQVTSVK